jgi:hypothetical protein
MGRDGSTTGGQHQGVVTMEASETTIGKASPMLQERHHDRLIEILDIKQYGKSSNYRNGNMVVLRNDPR